MENKIWKKAAAIKMCNKYFTEFVIQQKSHKNLNSK